MTEVTGAIDGQTVGSPFVFNSTVPGRSPNDPAVSYLYNQLVFSATGLANTKHQLVLSAPIIGGTPILGNIVLFDYVIYT
jgi:hypothetical protein